MKVMLEIEYPNDKIFAADILPTRIVDLNYGIYFEGKAKVVPAIPIEFIKEQIAKTTDINDEDELDFFYAGHLGYLLNLWEEQNEKDI